MEQCLAHSEIQMKIINNFQYFANDYNANWFVVKIHLYYANLKYDHDHLIFTYTFSIFIEVESLCTFITFCLIVAHRAVFCTF